MHCMKTAESVALFIGDDILRARYVVLAEGANSVLAERHGLVTRPLLKTQSR